MFKKKYLLFTILGVMLLFSCSYFDTSWVLRVNDFKISKEDFVERLERSMLYRNQKSFTFADLKDFADRSMVNSLLFTVEGYAQGIEKEHQVQKAIQFSHIHFIAGKKGPLFKAAIPQQINVSANELKQLYDKKKQKRRVAFIRVNSKTVADSVYFLLKKGENFARLAKKYSKDKEYSQKGGEIKEWFIYGEGHLPPDQEKAIFDLKTVGDFSEPVVSKRGYYIFKLVEMQKNPVASFDVEKDKLLTHVRSIKREAAIEKYSKGLFKKYHFQIDREGANMFLQLCRERINKAGIQLSDSTSSQNVHNTTFVTYDNVRMTVSDVVKKYFRNFLLQRSKIKSSSDVESRIADWFMPDLLYLDAKNRGLLEKPEVKRAFRRSEWRIIGGECEKRMAARGINVTPEEVNQRYEREKEKWKKFSPKNAKYQIRLKIRSEKRIAKSKKVREELRNKYHIVFNDRALKKLAKELNRKKASA